MASGNLLIVDETGEDVRAKAAQQKTVVFRQVDARMIMHFFKDKFEHISLMEVSITRLPKEGDIEELTFVFDKSDTKVDKAISHLRQAICDMDKEEVDDIPTDKAKTVDEFVKNYNEDDPSILIIPEAGKVIVIGGNNDDVQKAAHKLKVKVGKIKPNTRRHGGTAQVQEETSSSRRYDRNSNSFRSNSSSVRSGDDSFDFTAKINKDFTLKIYKENITRVKVDVIVNAANANMMHGGGVAWVISDAAGYEMDEASKSIVTKKGPVAPGENIITTAGKLKNRYAGVIHAVGPMWHDYRDKVECLEVLYHCIWNILQACDMNDYRTVAMSAISSGIFAVPKELCADMYVAAATDFAAKKSKGKFKYPDELHIIDIDVKILELVKFSVEKWKRNPKSVCPSKSYEKYKNDNPYNQGGSTYSNATRGRRHVGHGQNASVGSVSVVKGKHDVKNDSVRANFESSFRKLPTETFRWGGKAQVYLIGKVTTVKIFKGEIVKTNKTMDAVVCGIDKSLEARGFIADALKKAGGPAYQSKYQKMIDSHRGSPRLSDVLKCGGGNLGVPHVMFIVMERITYADAREIETYQDAIQNILQKASQWKFKKIVIPMFGTGQIQTNKACLRKCAVAMLKALDIFVDTHNGKDGLQEIHLTNNSQVVNDVLTEVFDEVASAGDNHSHGNRQHHRSHSNSSSPSDDDEGSVRKSYNKNYGDRDPDEKRTYTAQGQERDTKIDKNGHNKASRRDSDGGRNHGGSRRDGRKLSGLGSRSEDDKDKDGQNDDDASASSTAEKPKKGNLNIIEI